MSDYYPNRLRHWAEALASKWYIHAPASRDPNVLIGMAEAWDADKAALHAMTEEANAEGVRATKAEAEARELRAVIKAHNERVDAACKLWKENGHCDARGYHGDRCVDCPREWEIENA